MKQDMFEWLENEIASIKTPNFHIVDGAVNTLTQKAINESLVTVPRFYKDFVQKCGSARLYLHPANRNYKVVVFGAPRESVKDNGNNIYHIGSYDGASVYFKETTNVFECTIYEYESGYEEKVAVDFPLFEGA